MSDRFVADLARTFAALSPGGRCLLAVSGGADSMALLHALAAARQRRDLRRVSLVVGHVDHRLRPDSGEDARFVREAAERLGVPFFLATVRVGRAGGLEEAAREARYEALERLAVESGAESVAAAHTATDQAETLLWRLVRGSGARGLGGMAPERPLGAVRLLRPMLGFSREAVRAFCERRQVPFRDDPTNVDDRPRARLRSEVLPVLERLAPGAVERIAAAAGRLREDEAVLEALAAPPDDRIESFARLPTALRRRALSGWAERVTGSRRRLGAPHLEALDALVCTGRGEVELPSTRTVRRVAMVEDGELRLSERTPGLGRRAEGGAKGENPASERLFTTGE